jgi:predicted site-specific integrase-resolvase
MTKLLTPAEVAKTVTKWIRQGYLPARNLSAGKQRATWRIDGAELARWIAKRPAA